LEGLEGLCPPWEERTGKKQEFVGGLPKQISPLWISRRLPEPTVALLHYTLKRDLIRADIA
jgi:hypothetical protein